MATQTVDANTLMRRKRKEFDDVFVSHYLTPYFLRLQNEQKTTMPLRGGEKKRRQLWSRVRDVIEKVNAFLDSDGDPLFKGGTFIPCDSVPERTKVGEIDEFDYQYLITLDGVNATRKVHPQTRSRDGPTNFGSKCFYELTRTGPGDRRVTLVARDIQNHFMADVHKAVSDMNICSKKAGPAVKLIVGLPAKNMADIIKIDLTFGIRANVRELFQESELTPLGVRLLQQSKLKGHFVSSMDYWKVCFVETEQDLMHRICVGPERNLYEEYLNMYSENSNYIRGSCYRVVKCLRDEFSVKDMYGDSILQSYPFKVTFLDMALKDEEDGVEWSSRNLGKNVIRLLKEVEERGQDHRICNLFVQDDDVMNESDRSYLECTRILGELERKDDWYCKEKALVIICGVLMVMTGLCAFVTHMAGFMKHWPKSTNYSDVPENSFAFQHSLAYYRHGPNIIDSGKDLKSSEIKLYFIQCVLAFLPMLVLRAQNGNGLSMVSRNETDVTRSYLAVSVMMKCASVLLMLYPCRALLPDSKDNMTPFIESHEISRLQALIWIRFATVLPVIYTFLRIQANACLSLLLDKDIIVTMNSLFGLPIDRYLHVYVAQTSTPISKGWRHRLALVTLAVIPSWSCFLMTAPYVYIWLEINGQTQVHVSVGEVLKGTLLLLAFTTFSSWQVPLRVLFVLLITTTYSMFPTEVLGTWFSIKDSLTIENACAILGISCTYACLRFYLYLNKYRSSIYFQISLLPECLTWVIHNVIISTLILIGSHFVSKCFDVISGFVLSCQFACMDPVKFLPLLIQIVFILSILTYISVAEISLRSKSVRQYIVNNK